MTNVPHQMFRVGQGVYFLDEFPEKRIIQTSVIRAIFQIESESWWYLIDGYTNLFSERELSINFEDLKCE